MRLWGRELVERVVVGVEEIAEAAVSELGLGLERAGGENGVALGLRVLHPRPPERRLAHAGVAREQQRARRDLGGDEAPDRRELVFSADDVVAHPAIVARLGVVRKTAPENTGAPHSAGQAAAR